MTRTRRYNSIKNELLKKAREAMLSAVQIYNNPQVTFKAEAFITLAVIGWTYLLHAYYRSVGVDYRYFHYTGKRKVYDKTKHGAPKRWDLEHCLKYSLCPIDNDAATNLHFLIGIRHEIEHQMTDKIDEYISPKLQACAINFDYYICKLFGNKYNVSRELSLVIQFSPLSLEQIDNLKGNLHITTNVKNFIVDFENTLSEDTLLSDRYAYRVQFSPISVNRAGQADQTIEFVKSNSPIAKDLVKSYALIKETEKKKYRPSKIVEIMQNKGFDKFNIHQHTVLWKSHDAKDAKHGYGVDIAGQWYWYENWLQVVEKYCNDHANEFKS